MSTVTLTAPRYPSQAARLFYCAPLPTESKLLYCIKRPLQLVGWVFAKFFTLLAQMALRTIAVLCGLSVVVLSLPFTGISYLFQEIFSPASLCNHVIGTVDQPLEEVVFQRHLRALAMRASAIKELTIASSPHAPCHLCVKTAEFLARLSPAKLTLINCTFDEEASKRWLSYDYVEKSPGIGIWKRWDRKKEGHTISAADQEALKNQIEELSENQTKKREFLSSLSIVGDGEEPLAFTGDLLAPLDSLQLRELCLCRCKMTSREELGMLAERGHSLHILADRKAMERFQDKVDKK